LATFRQNNVATSFCRSDVAALMAAVSRRLDAAGLSSRVRRRSRPAADRNT